MNPSSQVAEPSTFPVPDRPREHRRPETAIVIGGGVIGVCTAFALAERGVSVTLLERAAMASGASFGNAGLISVAHPPFPRPGVFEEFTRSLVDRSSPVRLRLSPSLSFLRFLLGFRNACRPRVYERNMRLVADLSRGTMPLFRRFADELGLEFEFTCAGYMDVFRDERLFESAVKGASLIRSLRFRETELSGEQAMQREPALKPGVVGAILHEESAFANPSAFVRSLASLARERGVTIRTECPVDTLLRDNGSILGVRTKEGEELRAECTVLAAGAWTDRIAAQVGVRVPMRCGKGYHLMIDQPTPPLRHSVHCGGAWISCTPMEGRLRVAGLLDLGTFDQSMPEERTELLQRLASEYIHGVEGAKVHTKWAGLRPILADGLPALGWAPHVRRLFVSTGHAMMGFWTGPISGKLAAEAIVDGETTIDLAPMRLSRLG